MRLSIGALLLYPWGMQSRATHATATHTTTILTADEQAAAQALMEARGIRRAHVHLCVAPLTRPSWELRGMILLEISCLVILLSTLPVVRDFLLARRWR
jgi:hypothetical protein